MCNIAQSTEVWLYFILVAAGGPRYELSGFDPIKDIPNGVYLTGFFSNYPTQEIVDDMFRFFNEKKLVPISGKVFDFENIRDAVIAQDTGAVNGKIVVKMQHYCDDETDIDRGRRHN